VRKLTGRRDRRGRRHQPADGRLRRDGHRWRQANSGLEQILTPSRLGRNQLRGVLSGSFDLMVGIVCDSHHCCNRAANARRCRASSPAETFMYLDLHKQTFAWGAGNRPGSRARPPSITQGGGTRSGRSRQRAFWACSRFSASSQAADRGPCRIVGDLLAVVGRQVMAISARRVPTGLRQAMGVRLRLADRALPLAHARQTSVTSRVTTSTASTGSSTSVTSPAGQRAWQTFARSHAAAGPQRGRPSRSRSVCRSASAAGTGDGCR
jgi:hypothetical protein